MTAIASAINKRLIVVRSIAESRHYGGRIMTEEEKPKPASENIVYGDIVYWVTICASFIALIGFVTAFVTKANFVSPSYLITSMWQGKSPAEIWEGAGQSVPVGHWYLSSLASGDGLAALGLTLGILSVTLGLIVSAIVLFKKKDIFFGTLALIAATLTIVPILGLIPLPS